jgi:hypothetical protein
VAYVALIVLGFGAVAAVAAVAAGRARAPRVAAVLGLVTAVLLAVTLGFDVALLRHASSGDCPDAQSTAGGFQIALAAAAAVASAAGFGAAVRAVRQIPTGGSVLALTQVLAVIAAIALAFAPWLCNLD